MVDATLQIESRFRRYLPRIYQEHAKHESPLNALLAIFEGFVSQIEQGIKDAPTQFDPYWARQEFLDWLASWVALPLDDEWEGENEKARKSYLISNAAELYRLRGTAASLRYMLSAFHGLDAVILEWTWPACMQIEITSTIGVDTTIMDQPDLEKCFVVVLRLDDEQRTKVAQFINLIPITLVGYEDLCVSIPLLKADIVNDEWFVRKLEKIKHLIDNEKPAHTRCYVVVEKPRHVLTAVPIPPMTIEVQSTIGSCAVA